MEAVFANLEKDGKNDVDSLVKWVKDSKVIDQSTESENKVRGLFDGVPDKQNVTLDQFKDVMKKIAEEFKFDLDGITNKLAEIGPKLLQDFAGGGATSSLAGAVKNLF